MTNLARTASQRTPTIGPTILCVFALLGSILNGAFAADIDRPNHGDALAQVKAFMTRIESTLGADQISSVSDLSYANGYQDDANHYVVVVKYRRVFKVSLKSISDATIDKKPNPNNLSGLIGTGMLSLLYGDFSPGDWVEEARSYLFLRTENGWLIVRPVEDASVLESHITPKPPKAPAQPFVPNAALLIDYSRGSCRAPKGTMIMDYGGAPGYAPMDHMDKVVIDPTVCRSMTVNVSHGDIGDLSLEQSAALGRSANETPFVADAVLNRDYHFMPECTFPKGTRVKIVGVDKIMRNFYAVQPDPTICPHTPAASNITVSPDALERIQ